MSSKPFVWQMIREACDNSKNAVITYKEIEQYILGKYGRINVTTITGQIIVCSVNHNSRINYLENQKERICESQYDYLFNIGRGQVVLYNPTKHGKWEIAMNENHTLIVRECGTMNKTAISIKDNEDDNIVDRVINREANDKLKGFVLQKWRANELLIDALTENKYTHVYCTIEMYEDVYKRVLTDHGNIHEFEQNKDYSTNFSIMSEEVKKALVSFFDIWCQCDYSESIHFAFYTDVDFVKERKTKSTDTLDIILPDKPLLELLIQKKYDIVLDIVLKIFKEYYLFTYEEKDIKGYTSSINTLSRDKWIVFFDNIDWKFGQPDEQELKSRILEKILKLKYFSSQTIRIPIGVEEFVFSRINDFFDERLTNKDNMKRLVHVAEVESIIYRLISGTDRPTDPIFKAWESEKASDKRDLMEKIISVCQDFSKQKVATYTIDIANGEIELRNNPKQRDVKAYEYRVYEACKKFLIKYIYDIESEVIEFSEPLIEHLFEEMFSISKIFLQDKSKSYDYPFIDDDMIKKTIYILFQSCYLSFEMKLI